MGAADRGERTGDTASVGAADDVDELDAAAAPASQPPSGAQVVYLCVLVDPHGTNPTNQQRRQNQETQGPQGMQGSTAAKHGRCPMSINRLSICTAFQQTNPGQNKGIQKWTSWATREPTYHPLLYSVCLCVCLLIVTASACLCLCLLIITCMCVSMYAAVHIEV